MDPDYVRVALASFGMDFEVILDTISEHLSKCDVSITHVFEHDCQNGTNASLTIQQGKEILEKAALLANTPRYLWVISTGKTSVELLKLFVMAQENNVTVILTTIGGWGNTKGTSQSVYDTGDVSTTLASLKGYKELQRK